MGWRGSMRSLGAAMRRAEREQERAFRAHQREAIRRLRDLERQQAEYARMEERARAEHEVALAQAQFDVLFSVHKECGDLIDWQDIISAAPPDKPQVALPERDSFNENRARRALQDFRPSLFDRILGRTETKRQRLTAEVTHAKHKDDHAHKAALAECDRLRKEGLAEWQEEMKDWEELKKLAARVQAGDEKAYAEAIAKLNPFRELKQLGSALKFRFTRKGMEIGLGVHGDEVIPSESKTLTKTGKVSVKKLAEGKRMEIYQDHICGCVIRVARETLALLPITICVVTASVKLLDTKTGHKVDQPILSAAFPRKTCGEVNWETVDPSDSMKNFVHRMKFKRSVGFEPIEPVRIADLQA